MKKLNLVYFNIPYIKSIVSSLYINKTRKLLNKQQQIFSHSFKVQTKAKHNHFYEEDGNDEEDVCSDRSVLSIGYDRSRLRP